MRHVLSTAFLTLVWLPWAWGQEVASTPSSSSAPAPAETISLTVPSGTTLQVVLDREVRVKKVGQPIHGRLLEPLYAFDREVVPADSEVVGRITALQGASKGRRVLAALEMNFTPARKIQVEFDEIILPDGQRIPIRAAATPGSGQPIQLITTVDKEKKNNPNSRDPALEKMKEKIREAKQEWKSAMEQVKKPGKMRRLGRFMLGQLPVHPQYVGAGTVYFAELQESIDFGRQPLAVPLATANDNSPPPCNLLAHAQLTTPLSSATTPKDAPVEAVLTEPLFSGEHLVFPQGSLLKGSVVEAQRARRFGRSGKLRMAFYEVVPPDGMEQALDANVEGIQAAEDQNVSLDLEGGTKTSAPKRRYVSTGVAVGLAVASYQDSDAEDGVSSTQGNASQGAAGGAAAFKLVGSVVGALVRSQSLSLAMGIFGAGRSAYSNFVGRGRDLVFPKGTAMEIGLSLSRDCSEPAKADPGGTQ